jgi:hypothetical protein
MLYEVMLSFSLQVGRARALGPASGPGSWLVSLHAVDAGVLGVAR